MPTNPITTEEEKHIEYVIRENPYKESFPFDGYIGKVLYPKIKERIGKLDKLRKQFIYNKAKEANGILSQDEKLTIAHGQKPREGSHGSFRIKRLRPATGSVRTYSSYEPYKPAGASESERAKLSMVDTTDFDPTGADVDDTRWYVADYGTLAMLAPGTPPPSPVRDVATFVTAPSNPCSQPAPLTAEKHTGKQSISYQQVHYWKAQDRRSFTDQGSVMGVNASTAVGFANVAVDSSKNGWEWLHLISFQMGGMDNFPQRAENLVAGTYDANSEMIGLEEAIKKLLLDNKATFTLEVRAPVIPATHVGSGQLSYDITYNGKTAHFEFSVRSQNRPFSGVGSIWLDHLKKQLAL